MITRENIGADIELYSSLRRQMMKELKNLPQGHIYYKTINGHSRPFVRVDGREQYLSQKYVRRIAGLQKRRELEAALSGIDANLACLDSIYGDFIDFDDIIPNYVSIPASGNNGRRLSRNEIAALLDRWAEYASGMPQYRGRHTTSDGTVVKSRAELTLYEYFASQSLAFIYEKPLMIGDETWYPDFTFLRESDGEVIVWEHFGMMNDEQYRNDALYKLDRYASSGYLPYRNLVTTYDFGNSSIDLPYVKELLRLMKLI